MTGFETAHAAWLKRHLNARNGERRARLLRGHRHAEKMFLQKVWYRQYGHFEHLHPEYEIVDWRGRSYFADFAWLMNSVKLIIEIKGFAAHVTEMDREKYCNELNRETFLTGLGYTVICFAYDDVAQRPDVCFSLLRLVMSRYQASKVPVSRAVLAEKEIIRLAMNLATVVKPIDVERHFGIDHRTAVLMLRKLSDKGWLYPVCPGKGKRIVGYTLVRGALDFL